MSVHLNRHENNEWIAAVEAVQEIASNTDSESGSKPFLNAMARFVRDDPRTVVRLLTLV